jgi:hypothetical protein
MIAAIYAHRFPRPSAQTQHTVLKLGADRSVTLMPP